VVCLRVRGGLESASKVFTPRRVDFPYADITPALLRGSIFCGFC